MRVLSNLAELLGSLPEGGRRTLDAILDALRAIFRVDPETRRRVAFSVAMIALSAKMAKADGLVSPAEVAAFREIFAIPPDEMRNVFRLYDLAKADTAGFEAYAARLRGFCADGHGGCALLEDILDGLFHIAKADGLVHHRELQLLARIAAIFEFTEDEFQAIKLRHVASGEDGDYAVLGVAPDTPQPAVRRRYLDLVRENHPDRLTARGVPDEFLAIATERMKAINAAYDRVARLRTA